MEFSFCMRHVLLLLTVLSVSAAAQAAESTYVGSAVCSSCHPQLTRPFNRNPHYLLTTEQKPERNGCEGCHGPASEHVRIRRAAAGQAPKEADPIFAFSVAHGSKGAQMAIEKCLSCHAKDMSRSQIRRSEHTQASIACNRCHSIHSAVSPRSLLSKNQANLCYDCHPSVRAQFNMPFKHRVNEGFMTCTDCHNPHGSPAPVSRMGVRPRMVENTASGEQPCLRCHVDLRGPFLFEHAAVRVDGCESCHFPHGSTNARLLRRPVTYTLCLECHNGSGNFGRQGDGVALQSSSHNMADPRYRNCTTCHLRIHGSNADRLFTR